MRFRSSVMFARRVRDGCSERVYEWVGLRSLRELGPPYENRAEQDWVGRRRGRENDGRPRLPVPREQFPEGEAMVRSCRSSRAAVLVLVLVVAVAACGGRPAVAQEADAGAAPAAAAATEVTSSPQALADYAKAANFQNNGAFDLAVEAWQSFLQTHADDPKVLEARYQLGVCQMQLKNYPQAREALQAVVDVPTPFQRREDALLNLGWTLYTLALQNQPQLFAQADQVFATMLQEFPQGTYRDQALFFRGESAYLQGKRDDAAAAYQQVVEQFPKSELRDDAIYALGVTCEELNRFEDAGKLYDVFLQEFPQHELLPEVNMRKAETILRAGNFEEAAQRFADVATTEGFKAADHAIYRQAFCRARLEQFEAAGNLFARIPREFPKSNYVAEATMSAARSYFRADQLELAAEWFDKVLAAGDQHAIEAAHWRVRMLLKQQQYEAARKMIEQYLPQAQDNPFFVNLKMDLADAIYGLPERRGESIPLYAKLVAEHPQHLLAPQALYNAAFGAMELKQYDQGLSSAQKFLQDFPQHRLLPDVKNVAAECQLQLGQNQAAADLFGELASSNADRPEAGQWRIRQALALYVQQKYAETLETLETQRSALTNPADLAEAYYLTGMSHFGLQQFAEARDDLQKSLEAQPQWRQADETWLNLSRAEGRLKNYDQARESIQQLLKQFPQSGLLDQAHFRLAEYAFAQSDYATAQDHYGQVIQDWPQSSLVPHALLGRGWSALRLDQREAAAADFTQLIEGQPDSAPARQAFYARALCRQQAGQFQESLADLEQFLQRDVSRAEKSDALYVQGLDQIGLGQIDQATATLESIVREDPDYAGLDKTLYELAWALKNHDQNDKAVAVFRHLTQRRGDSPLAAEACYHVGEQAYRDEEYAPAAAAYESALSRVANNAELQEKVCYKLGWARYQLQQYEAAVQAFQQQLQQQPEGALAGDAHFLLGECQFKLQNHQLALAAYQQAVGRRLSSEQMELLARLHAGQTAGQMGDWKQSLEWLQGLDGKYADSPYRPQVLYETGVAHQNLGQADEAARLFGEAADRATGELSAQARFMVGEVLYGKKDYVAAIREFRKVLFGFDNQASPEIQRWQAKAGLEAGQCAGLLAAQQTNPAERKRLVSLAREFLQQVKTRYPSSQEAAAAGEQLRKFGG